MINLLAALVLMIILVLAGWYVYRSKKSGRKCIGCPNGGHCAGCSGSCGEPQE